MFCFLSNVEINLTQQLRDFQLNVMNSFNVLALFRSLILTSLEPLFRECVSLGIFLLTSLPATVLASGLICPCCTYIRIA